MTVKHQHHHNDPPHWLDLVIEVLLAGLIAFMPFAFGAVEAWSELVVIGVTAAMCLCLGIRLLVRRDEPLVWSWAYLPIALFLILVLIQLLPLPAGLVKVLSPNTVELKTTLLQDLPDAASELQSPTLSFYPHVTRHNLRLLLAVTIVFFVVVNTFKRSEQIKRFLFEIAIVGAAVAVLAALQDISGTPNIYWVGPAGRGRANAGPFIHYNHFGQFMNLTMGVALGLLLVTLHRIFRRRGFNKSILIEQWRESKLRMVWFLAGTIVLGAVTLCLSQSRGAMVGMVAAFSFATFCLARVRNLPGKGWFTVPIILAVFGVTLFVGFDAIANRLATLRSAESFADRIQILKDLTHLWSKFPAMGMGLGTHAFVYPMFDRSTNLALAEYAENEYAQILEEVGLIGLLLVIAFVAIQATIYARAIRNSEPSIRIAAVGLGFGLIAVLIQSVCDFGQHVPANAMLTAVCFGLLISLARQASKTKEEHTKTDETLAPVRGWRSLRLTGLVGSAAICSWALIGGWNAYQADLEWRKALVAESALEKAGWQGSNEAFTTLLQHASNASNVAPANAEYRYSLNAYRWRSISRVLDENGNIVVTPQSLEFTRRIVSELHRTRLLCPTYANPYTLAGQLELAVLNDPAGANHLRLAFKLAQTDSTACFDVAQLDAQEGKWADAAAKFQRYLALSGSFDHVVSAYLQVSQPEQALAMARGNRGRLERAAAGFENRKEYQQFARQARDEAFALLEAECKLDNAPADVLATLAEHYCKLEDYQAAAEVYRRALTLDYGQVEWRLALADALAKSEQVPEAIHEARICLRLRPQMNDARRLLGELSLLPAGRNE